MIHIQPPFWLTWYAKLVYVLLFILALYGLLNFYKHKIDLESSLNLERRKSQNDLELNNERLRFYTNITHELRTPLTLILGPLEDLLSDGTLSPKHANKISIIHDSAIPPAESLSIVFWTSVKQRLKTGNWQWQGEIWRNWYRKSGYVIKN